MAQSVFFCTRQFVRSHGKQPRGFGCWAFQFDEAEVRFTPRAMNFSEAKSWARAVAKDEGFTEVDVMP